MYKMKKVLKSMLGLSMIVFVWISICLWNSFWGRDRNRDAEFPFGDGNANQECENTDLWNCTDIKSENSILNRLLDVFNLNIKEDSDHKFLDYVKAILNVALGLVSMIALVMTIYTFYLMFFTENDAWAKKAKWNLVGIFIALAIIWLSWLIVSFIFRWYWKNWESRIGDIEGTGNMSMIDEELSNQIYFNV